MKRPDMADAVRAFLRHYVDPADFIVSAVSRETVDDGVLAPVRSDHAAQVRHPWHGRRHAVRSWMRSAVGRCSVRSWRARVAPPSRSATTADCRARNWRQALVKGLCASGIEAVRIGRGPTPMLYYASTTLKTDGAVMVTGSHNPPDYNGFKMVLGGSALLRRSDPCAWASRRWQATWYQETAGPVAQRRRRGRLRCSPAHRLGWRRPPAEGRVGQRQRRRGRGAATAGRGAAGRAYRAEWRDRRPVPGASSRSDGAGQSAAADRGGGGAGARTWHRARWRRGSHRVDRR